MASKQGEFDRVMPLLKQHDQTMHGLADEYDSAVSKSRAVHEDADRLRALAAEDEAARSRLARLIEELMEKIRLAGACPACSAGKHWACLPAVTLPSRLLHCSAPHFLHACTYQVRSGVL